MNSFRCISKTENIYICLFLQVLLSFKWLVPADLTDTVWLSPIQVKYSHGEMVILENSAMEIQTGSVNQNKSKLYSRKIVFKYEKYYFLGLKIFTVSK